MSGTVAEKPVEALSEAEAIEELAGEGRPVTREAVLERVSQRLRRRGECGVGIPIWVITGILSGIVSHLVQRWLREREERNK